MSAGSSGRTHSGGCASKQRKFVQFRPYEQRLEAEATPRNGVLALKYAPGPEPEPEPEENVHEVENDMVSRCFSDR